MTTPYLIPVTDTIETAWAKTRGTRTIFWEAIGVASLVLFFVYLGLCLLPEVGWLPFLLGFIGQLIAALLLAGLIYLGLRVAFDLPIEYSNVFRGFQTDILPSLVGVAIIKYLIMGVFSLLNMGFMVLLVPDLFGYFMGSSPATTQVMAIPILVVLVLLSMLLAGYVVVRLMLASSFVLDKKVGPWIAIKKSWEATRHNFWQIAGIILLEQFIILLSMIPLGIGLIWTIPFMFVVHGVIYQRLLVNVELNEAGSKC